MTMAWLLRSGEVLAAAEIASSRRARRRGLLGRDSVDGALLIEPGRAVHTLGMRFAIDVAYCRRVGDELEVLELSTMAPWRLGAPRLRARCVIEAEAGAFARWGLAQGDLLEIQ